MMQRMNHSNERKLDGSEGNTLIDVIDYMYVNVVLLNYM